MLNFIVFFTYEINSKNLKSMAIVKADSIEEVGNKVNQTIDKEEYPNYHIWWIEELESMYGGNDIIIP